MTKSRVLVIVIVVLTLGVFAWVISIMERKPTTNDAYVYADTVNITPQVSGNIVELPIKENQLVKKGEVLLKIDPRAYIDRLNRAEARLAQLEQKIILTQRDVNAQALNAQAAQTRILAAQAQTDKDYRTLRRYEELQKKQYISKEMLDHAYAAQQSSSSQLQKLRVQAQAAQAAISSVSALEAQRQVIRAEIAAASLNLERTTITAPFEGRVTSLKTTLGQYASPKSPIFTLIDVNRWYVVANFRESTLKHIHKNATADVYLMTNTKKIYHGIVDSVGYGVFPDDVNSDQEGLPSIQRDINWVRLATRFPVRIRVLHPDTSQFRIGASAIATMTGKKVASETGGSND